MTPGMKTCGTRLLYSTQSSPYLHITNYTPQNSTKIAAGEVLLRAAVLITQRPVYDHDREEGRVKIPDFIMLQFFIRGRETSRTEASSRSRTPNPSTWP
jgi:hypothetical protein